MGDFNSRTGKYSDCVSQEGNTMITNDQSHLSSGSTQRNSFDNNINNHGKRLLEICRSADLRILNGRVSGDSLGRATFHGKAGISVVDYAICDQTLFSHILNFIVKEPTYLSDHSPLVTWLCTDTDIRNQDPSPESDTLTRLPKQFMWESELYTKIQSNSSISKFANDNSRIFK